MLRRVKELTLLSDGPTITGGVCHGCGSKFIALPGVDDEEAVRREIRDQLLVQPFRSSEMDVLFFLYIKSRDL
jgi:hypothetical protein